VQRVLRHPLVDRGYEPKGWRCTTCHQPDHLRADQVKVNAQPYAPTPLPEPEGSPL
jgi:hypothetical protein